MTTMRVAINAVNMKKAHALVERGKLIAKLHSPDYDSM